MMLCRAKTEDVFLKSILETVKRPSLDSEQATQKVDESLKDIAVYSVIELYMLHKHKQFLNNKEGQSHE